MYHYRLTSFAAFTTAFFLVQVFSALLIWSILVYARTQSEPDVVTRQSHKKPSQGDLLRAADNAEAEEARTRQREANLQEQRRMIINPSRHTVLAALREKDRDSETDLATEDEDRTSQRSSRSWEVAEPIKEEESEDEPANVEDEKASLVSGGVSLPILSAMPICESPYKIRAVLHLERNGRYFRNFPLKHDSFVCRHR